MQISKRYAVEHVGNRVSDCAHHPADRTRLYVATIAAGLKSSAACTRNGRERAIDHPNDPADFDLAWDPRQHVTAARTLSAMDNSGVA